MKIKLALGVTFIVLLFAVQSIPVAAIDVEGVLYDDSIVGDKDYTWVVDTLVTEDGSDSWVWAWANNLTLSEGTKITLRWNASGPDEATSAGLAGPISNAGLTTKVDDKELNFTADETFFNFLIAPLYVKNNLNQIEAGLNALERLWFNSYKLPSADLPPAYSQYIWTYSNVNGTLENTGVNGTAGTIILGQVTTHDFFETLTPEVYVFDILYDAVTGIVKEVRYPSEGSSKDPTAPVADADQGMTKGLTSLVIKYTGTLPGASAPGFEAFIVLAGLAIIPVIIKRRK